jgi:hypothetical protein
MKKHVGQVYRLIILLPYTYLILRDILWWCFDARAADKTVETSYSIFYTQWSRVHLEKLTSFQRVAQLVEALRYKSVGRGFDSRWCHWNFLLT